MEVGYAGAAATAAGFFPSTRPRMPANSSTPPAIRQMIPEILKVAATPLRFARPGTLTTRIWLGSLVL
jgi:hypothetical protein